MRFASNRLPGRRVAVIAFALAVTAVLVIAGTASAVKINAGGYFAQPTYKGSPLTSTTLNFTVTPSKKKVKDTKISPFLPNSCGAGGPPPTEKSKTTKIKGGKFTAVVNELSNSGKVTATSTVKGKFKANGKVKGTFSTTVPGHSDCNASGYKFTAQLGG
jgi:hypothetical protein